MPDENDTTEVEETVETQEPKTESHEAKPSKAEKSVPQSEVNRLLAKERREAQTKYSALQAELDALKQQVAEEHEQAESKAKERVEELRKDLPPETLELLDMLSPLDQLDWLSKHSTPAKKVIPKTPEARKERPEPKVPVII